MADEPLRQELATLVDKWQYTDGKGYRGFYEDVVDLLAARPTPAPRPVVDRHTLAIALHDIACPDRRCEPTWMGKYFAQADAVLALLPTEEDTKGRSFIEIVDETDSEYAFNGDKADEVWMDRPDEHVHSNGPDAADCTTCDTKGEGS